MRHIGCVRLDCMTRAPCDQHASCDQREGAHHRGDRGPVPDPPAWVVHTWGRAGRTPRATASPSACRVHCRTPAAVHPHAVHLWPCAIPMHTRYTVSQPCPSADHTAYLVARGMDAEAWPTPWLVRQHTRRQDRRSCERRAVGSEPWPWRRRWSWSRVRRTTLRSCHVHTGPFRPGGLARCRRRTSRCRSPWSPHLFGGGGFVRGGLLGGGRVFGGRVIGGGWRGGLGTIGLSRAHRQEVAQRCCRGSRAVVRWRCPAGLPPVGTWHPHNR